MLMSPDPFSIGKGGRRKTKSYIESATALSGYEFIARNDGFWRAPELVFCYETKDRKQMIDFKFDALYS